MGKEIRGAFSVVGVLVLLFCGLLYARISGSAVVLPQVSLPAPAQFEPPPRTVHSQPTIVQEGAWDELTTPVRASLDPPIASPEQAQRLEVRRRADNVRRVGEVELTSAESVAELTNPREPATRSAGHHERLEAIRYPDLAP